MYKREILVDSKKNDFFKITRNNFYLKDCIKSYEVITSVAKKLEKETKRFDYWNFLI